MARNYYEILEYVAPEEINKAYKRLGLKCHPDKLLPKKRKISRIVKKAINGAALSKLELEEMQSL
ncbi:hypothetical protein EJB10_02180 [Wolbachia endosymbiont of Brugia malayi]|uniref:hypothetical protein n=1 Tax=Wolbachia endosymbiont of Brugia malayi TaxID=80849 RepID=UPI00004C9232|nr:hypothetical protein [Wolbachia endosymbiont of Brugia malayi]AAW70625.1 Predicted protein [Wolbachia endosymbiont strain TRS of Brugia malayi]QCB61612.1 hypothetical protein EJB10_02180 [Wolbachia endosymbiont of Brugia malayi]